MEFSLKLGACHLFLVVEDVVVGGEYNERGVGVGSIFHVFNKVVKNGYNRDSASTFLFTNLQSHVVMVLDSSLGR